ncbi:uncharacterized protein V6R79_019101 [Siganus canaliculatus]
MLLCNCVYFIARSTDRIASLWVYFSHFMQVKVIQLYGRDQLRSGTHQWSLCTDQRTSSSLTQYKWVQTSGTVADTTGPCTETTVPLVGRRSGPVSLAPLVVTTTGPCQTTESAATPVGAIGSSPVRVCPTDRYKSGVLLQTGGVMTEDDDESVQRLRSQRFPLYTPRCSIWPPSNCSPDQAMTAFKGIWTQEFWRCVGGEFFAMLLFVLLSLGSTIHWGAVEVDPSPPDLVLISLGFGLSIATMVQCFGHISGAHMNPAVTAAMVVTRKLSLAKAVFYLLAQCVGAIVGAAILFGVTPATVRGGMGVTKVTPSVSVGNALVIELFITFQLVFTVFASCDHRRNDLKGSSALAIGLSVCVGHLFAIPYTGASMNPARSFGPAMVTWYWENHWVYWVGPTLGGSLAAALYEYLFCPKPERKKRYSDAFIKTSFTGNKHRQDSVAAAEPLFTVMDVERAEREVPEEVLSSV